MRGKRFFCGFPPDRQSAGGELPGLRGLVNLGHLKRRGHRDCGQRLAVRIELGPRPDAAPRLVIGAGDDGRVVSQDLKPAELRGLIRALGLGVLDVCAQTLRRCLRAVLA